MPGVSNMKGPMNFQAVVLAGGISKGLFPLVSKDVPTALLPVGNRPVLSYTLEMLEANHFNHLLVVVAGEEVAVKIGGWIQEAFQGRLSVEIAAVPEDSGTAEAIRAVSHRITADDFIVLDGNLICDVPLGAVAAQHRRHAAACTVLLSPQPTSSTEGGGAKDKSKNQALDYVGLDASQQSLLFCAASSTVGHELRVRRSILRAAGQMTIRTDLMDTHLYIFTRRVLDVLEQRPAISSLKRDLLPYLVRSQLAPAQAVEAPQHSRSSLSLGKDEPASDNPPRPGSSSGLLPMELSHARLPGLEGAHTKCCVYMAGKEKYCNRISSLQAYLDVNRDVAGDAVHLTGFPVSAYNNVVHQTASFGSKTTVGAACMLGEGSKLGDKCSVKRSVVGRHCRIGNNVKIINSVVMNHVVIDDNCLVQNTVLCSNVHVQERATLKDCYVGAGYVVGGGVEHRGESLSKNKA